jgi:hypothetical protein
MKSYQDGKKAGELTTVNPCDDPVHGLLAVFFEILSKIAVIKCCNFSHLCKMRYTNPEN